MLDAILGRKIEQTQYFTKDGKRIPVTLIEAGPCPIVQIKTKSTDGYNAICLGFGIRKKNIKKPLLGIIKKAGIEKAPRFLRETKIENELPAMKPGDVIKVADVFKVGDKVDITGTSKGKGFAGVVKRHHFAGGPKTHGQSDRLRAPGSIGQTTTPGRVYKGKRMAGRMGGEKVTVKNLEVVEVKPEENLLLVKGLVPGGKNSLLIIKKTKNLS